MGVNPKTHHTYHRENQLLKTKTLNSLPFFSLSGSRTAIAYSACCRAFTLVLVFMAFSFPVVMLFFGESLLNVRSYPFPQAP
jgi:hypothetical protein